jgi:hypothetical protein
MYSEVGPLVGEDVGKVCTGEAVGPTLGSAVTGADVGGADTGEALGPRMGGSETREELGSGVTGAAVGAPDTGKAPGLWVGSIFSVVDESLIATGWSVGSPDGSAVVVSSITGARAGLVVVELTLGAGDTPGDSSMVTPLSTTGSGSVSGSPLPISVAVEANGS